MKDLNLTPDDPLLTAYALGELEGEELAAVEAAVRRDPKLLALVEEIRATTVQLEAALAAEPDADSVAAAAANSTMRHPEFDEYRRVKRGPLAQMFQFPQIYFVVGGAAAACFALVAALHTPPPAPLAKPKPVNYITVPIAFEPTERRGETDSTMTVSVGRLNPPGGATATPGPLTPVTPIDPTVSVANNSESAKPPLISPSGNARNAIVATDTPTPAATEPLRPGIDEKPAKEASQEPATLAINTVTPAPSPIAPPESGASRTSDALGRVPTPEVHTVAPTNGVRITLADPALARDLPQPTSGGATSAPIVVSTPQTPARPPVTIIPGQVVTTLNTGASDPRLAFRSGPAQPVPTTTPDDDTVVRFESFTNNGGVRESGAAATKLGVGTFTRVASGKRKAPPPRGALFYAGNTPRRANTPDNDFVGVEESRKSTFPVDVNKDSYDQIRRALANNVLPAREDVRIEELVNFFAYRYPAPGAKDDAPVAQALEISQAPWAPSHRLVRVALKGREPGAADRLSAIAKDVKVEVIFNAAKVSSYRLIGFENPRLNPEEFDRTEGVDIGAGHTITALYEVIPIGLEAARVADKPAADNPLFQRGVVVSSRLETPDQEQKLTDELVLVSVAYRKPDSLFNLVRHAVFRGIDPEKRFDEASADFKFAAAVAEYGMILRHSPHKGNGTLGDVLAWAAAGAGSNADDPRGHRGEFLNVVRRTQALMR